ncbi:MAG TPA: serine protease [Thermoanaerobaculales bacterium]|nr:serine protease [Thermoanaerobaculales bacterium]HPA80154.1 serine protease [Thermoanaerobaculales bacterium]HQL31322.1 serine protease [Thermoanaerobaculales bacterium]HQN94767.1 serine protease [Thermoanaerobaculales bacterium]
MRTTHRSVSKVLAVLAVIGVALAAPAVATADDAPAVGPTVAGEVAPIDVKAGYSHQNSELRVVSHPGASIIFVHLVDLTLAPGVELVISDADKTTSHPYPGSGFSTDATPGKWAFGVPGDTALLELRVADPALARDLAGSGFQVDAYAWGYPVGGLESVCGADDRDDVECYAASHPTEYERSHAVARHYRIESPYVYLCTAWRVDPGDKMFTNEHCIEQASWLAASQFHFNYERAECHGTTNKPVTTVTGNTLLLNNPTFDFALFTINNPAAVEQFGYLELDPRTPVLHEEIYMAGHPDGNPKIFALESDMNTSGYCEIDAVGHPLIGPTDSGYYCDTSGGQSGSPVLARSTHKVIAIHHASYATCTGNQMNAGVRMQWIWNYVSPYFSGIFEDGFETGDMSAWSVTVP